MIQTKYESKRGAQIPAPDLYYDSLLLYPVKAPVLFLVRVLWASVLHWGNLYFIKTVSSSLMDYSLGKLANKIYDFFVATMGYMLSDSSIKRSFNVLRTIQI